MMQDVSLQGRALVGDIGGTNARLALCHLEIERCVQASPRRASCSLR